MSRILKAVVSLAVLAAIGWTAWWFVAARGQEAAIAAWLDAREAEGWQAEAAGLDVTGFPQSFVTRLEAPQLADPEAGWAWSAPSLVFESPVFDPTHVRARFAERQTVAVPGERATVTAGEFGALLSLFPGTALRLREGALSVRDLAIDGQSGWTARAGVLDAAVARRDNAAEPERAHAVSLDATGVVLPERLVATLDPTGMLEREVSHVRLEGIAVPDRDLDRRVIETGEIGFETLVVRQASFDWDGMGMAVSGRLDADAEGYAEGALDVSLSEWRRMVALARTSGALPGNIADAVEGALGLVAMLNSSDTLDVTLRFGGGRMRVGPVPVGDAPRMRVPAGAGS